MGSLGRGFQPCGPFKRGNRFWSSSTSQSIAVCWLHASRFVACKTLMTTSTLVREPRCRESKTDATAAADGADQGRCARSRGLSGTHASRCSRQPLIFFLGLPHTFWQLPQRASHDAAPNHLLMCSHRRGTWCIPARHDASGKRSQFSKNGIAIFIFLGHF